MSRPVRRFDRSIVEGPLGPAVWAIAWPTMLQNVVAGLQGIVDHAMVGHYVGYTGNAAIGVSWQIFLVVMVFTGSIFTGMGVLVARHAGADQPAEADRTVYQGFLVATFLALGVFAPVGWLAAPALLDLVNATPAVQAEALPYLRTLLLCGVGMMHVFMLAGALRAAGDAKTPMRFGFLVTVLNVAFNVVLIPGLGPIPALGTLGAAVGTVAANFVAAAALYVLLASGRLVIGFRRGMGLAPDWRRIAAIFRLGLPAGFQGIAMNVGGVLLIRFVGGLPRSAAAQAAYAVGYTQLFSLITWTSVGLMAAASTVTGQNLGAGHPDRSARAPRLAAVIGWTIALAVGSLFVFAPRALLGVFGLEDPDVLALGRQLLAFLAVSGFFVTVALAYTGALQGSGDTKSPLYITLVSQLVLPLGLCAAIDLMSELRAVHIWGAIVLGHVTRAVLSVWRFRQGHWRDLELPSARAERQV